MDKFKILLQKRPIYLFLLPIFFVLHGYTENFPSIPLTDAIVLVLKYVLVIAALSAIGFLVFRNWHKSFLYVFLLMSTEFLFGALHDFVKNFFADQFISKYSFLLPAIMIFFVAVFISLRKTKKRLLKLVAYFNIVLLILILIDTATLSLKLSKYDRGTEPSYGFIDCDHCATPNIYLIILDEYAGKKGLQDLFSYDNSNFETELSKRGFFCVKNPKSNYNYTPYSMASTLSMNYLNGITIRSNDAKNRNVCYRNINKNDLVHTLNKFGYNFFNISLFEFADKHPEANNNRFYTTREAIITTQTLTGRIVKDLSYHLYTTFNFPAVRRSYHKKLINNIHDTYKKTVSLARDSSIAPKFVYTHFLMPHYPYLFDKDGHELPFEQVMKGGNMNLYLGYLQYCNKLSLSLVDSILKIEKKPPIIILMSDHGYTKNSSKFGPNYNFLNMINIFLPDKNYADFPDTLSNVNLFRVLLNSQFHQQLPLLKDSTSYLIEY